MHPLYRLLGLIFANNMSFLYDKVFQDAYYKVWIILGNNLSRVYFWLSAQTSDCLRQEKH